MRRLISFPNARLDIAARQASADDDAWEKCGALPIGRTSTKMAEKLGSTFSKTQAPLGSALWMAVDARWDGKAWAGRRRGRFCMEGLGAGRENHGIDVKAIGDGAIA